MALGYEGLIKLGAYYVLGTGSSVPRTRLRLESSSGYGGKIKTPETQIGIGQPFNYDWTQVDGSISFEMTRDVFEFELHPWLFDRQSVKEINLKSRKDNVQQYMNCLFNSISISASEGGVVDGSVGFVALKQDVYTWGDLYKNNRRGMATDLGLICPPTNFPEPLNPSATPNRIPIPFWNTTVWIKATTTAVKKNFVNWSLDFSQEVVKFFGCKDSTFPSLTDPLAKEPLYMAVGPMTVTFSGSYMDDFTGLANGYLGNHLAQIEVDLAGKSIKLLRLEASTESDDVQTAEAFVPLTVEYAAYEIKST